MPQNRLELRTVAELQAHIVGLSGGLVTFDGDLASGKTTLAREIAKTLGVPALDLDAFLTRGQGGVF
ncbi:hypothetical protein [Paraburkholderia unamae]|uniref:Uncharacterized protein n=1 Tax=Paraburkholderia unamae TaxID=219649 RepID=A0ACC6RWF7_9BURK